MVHDVININEQQRKKSERRISLIMHCLLIYIFKNFYTVSDCGQNTEKKTVKIYKFTFLHFTL